MYEKVAEAGKVWDKGRNWTTVVLEVVPGTLPGGAKEPSSSTNKTKKDKTKKKSPTDDLDDQDENSDDDESDSDPGFDWSGQTSDPNQQLQPDEDVLEIPVFVHMEWDSDNQIDSEQAVGRAGTGGSDTVKRELAYWMVLGVGRIVREIV